MGLNPFRRAAPRYYTPDRSRDEFVIYISARQPPPVVVPKQLQSCIPCVVWEERITTLAAFAARYQWPLLERLYLLIALFTVIILPAVLYPVVLGSMPHPAAGAPAQPGGPPAEPAGHSAHHQLVARGISVAISVGTFLAFALPVALWTWIRRRAVSALVGSWEVDDVHERGLAGTAVPTWRCTPPSFFGSSMKLTIAIPASRQPSVFHTDVYVSAYIHAANESPDVPVPAVPRPTRRGETHMSVVGAVPMWSPKRSSFGSMAKA